MVIFNELKVPGMLYLMYRIDHKTRPGYKFHLNTVQISILTQYGCETGKQLPISIMHMGFAIA
jgi:hypothetical protein